MEVYEPRIPSREYLEHHIAVTKNKSMRQNNELKVCTKIAPKDVNKILLEILRTL